MKYYIENTDNKNVNLIHLKSISSAFHSFTLLWCLISLLVPISKGLTSLTKRKQLNDNCIRQLSGHIYQ